jgi:hypothetical protein
MLSYIFPVRHWALWLLLSVPSPCSAEEVSRVPPALSRKDEEIRGLLRQIRRSQAELESLAGAYLADPDLRRVERQRDRLLSSLQENDVRLDRALEELRVSFAEGLFMSVAPSGLKNFGKDATVAAGMAGIVTCDRAINSDARAAMRSMREALSMDEERFEAGLRMRGTLRRHRLFVVAGLFVIGLLACVNTALYLRCRRMASSPAAGAGEAEPRALSDDSAPKREPVRPGGLGALFSGGFTMGLIAFTGMAVLGDSVLVTLYLGDVGLVASHAQFIQALVSSKGFVAGSVFLFTGAAFAGGLISGLLSRALFHDSLLLGLALALVSAACLGAFGFPWSYNRMMALLSIVGALWSSLCLYYLRKVRELAIAENGGGPS